MKNSNSQQTPVTLERQLRHDARQRRAWIDQQPYPLGHYPPRGSSAAPDGAPAPADPRVLRWLLGGLSAAAVAILAVSFLMIDRPVDAPAELTPTADHPFVNAPGLATALSQRSVHGVLRGLESWELRVNRGVGPMLTGASDLPSHLDDWPRWVDDAEARLRAPLQQELANLRADLQTAASYVRQQWRVEDPSPASQAAPPAGLLPFTPWV